jgi:hypothetical protein
MHPLAENRTSMKLPNGFFLKQSARVAGLLLLGALVLSVGCVSLDKPALVEECSTHGSCSDNPTNPGPDAKDDVAPANSDLVDEPVGGKEEIGPEGPALPDVGADKADTTLGKQDTSGPESSSSDVVTLGDVKPDVEPDSMVFADVEPDQGPDLEPDATELGKDDVAKDDLIKEDLIKQDVIKEDVVKEDVVREDVIKEDVAGPEVPRDLPPDSASNCSIFYGSSPATGSQGHPPASGTTKAFCVATCDDIAGWGCANCEGRTIVVNGTTVAKIGDPLTKKNGFYVFEISAGSNTSAGVYWWSSGWATTCTAPAGGF